MARKNRSIQGKSLSEQKITETKNSTLALIIINREWRLQPGSNGWKAIGFTTAPSLFLQEDLFLPHSMYERNNFLLFLGHQISQGIVQSGEGKDLELNIVHECCCGYLKCKTLFVNVINRRFYCCIFYPQKSFKVVMKKKKEKKKENTSVVAIYENNSNLPWLIYLVFILKTELNSSYWSVTTDF